MLSGFSFRLDFVFNINSLIFNISHYQKLVNVINSLMFLLTSFGLAEALPLAIRGFVLLHYCVCSCPKKHEMSFIYNHTHF